MCHQIIGITPSLNKSEPSLSKVFIKSLYYAVIGYVPALIVSLYVILMLAAIAIPSLKDTICLQSYKEQYQFYCPFFERVFEFKSGPWMLPITIITLVFFSLWILRITLRLSNHNFRLSYIRQNKISISRVACFFILSNIAFAFLGMLTAPIAIFIPGFIISFLFWLIWHEKGIWGDLTPFKKDKTQRSKLFKISISCKDILTLLWRSVVLSLWLDIILLILRNIVSTWSGIISSGVNLETPWCFSPIFFPYIISAHIGGLAILPLIYLFADTYSSLKVSLVKSIIPIIVTGILLISLWKIHNFVYQYEFDKDFSQLTGIKEPDGLSDKYTRSVVVLSDGSYELFTYASNKRVHGFHPGFTAKINCSRDNLQKAESLKTYLEKKDYQTFLASPYFSYLSGFRGSYAQNWELDKLFETRFLSLAKTNNIIDGVLLITLRSAFAQVKPLYIETLNKLLDESTFYIGPCASKKLGDLYLHYVQIKQAEKLYQKAAWADMIRLIIPYQI